jgi:hypothetical protein
MHRTPRSRGGFTLGTCGAGSVILVVRCDMKSHFSLFSRGNLTKPCLSRQVFQGSRHRMGGSNATVLGLKPSRQCSQPGSLKPGVALESEGRVKLIKHAQASSKEMSHTRLFKAQAREGQRSGSGRRTWPDANDAPPVYRVDLTPPVRNAEHGNAVAPGHAVRGRPNRKAG